MNERLSAAVLTGWAAGAADFSIRPTTFSLPDKTIRKKNAVAKHRGEFFSVHPENDGSKPWTMTRRKIKIMIITR